MTVVAPGVENANRTSASCLAQLLCERADSNPSCGWALKLLYHQGPVPRSLAPSGEELALQLGYDQLLSASRQAAAALQQVGVTRGDRVLLVLPTGLSWIATFFGCQLLGAVPVPLVPPWSLEHLLLHAERMAQVIDVCAASATVIEPSLLAVLQATGTPASSRFTALPCVVPEQLFAGSGEGVQPVMVEPEAPAFIQFTSGSTSDPKGVVISQSAALHNSHFIGERLQIVPGDIGCSWLPLFHDMGLIGHLLVPLYWGTPSVLLPPEVFARQPRVWLEALGRHRATITTAPNSAYDICASKILERDVARLDLSSVRAALCGGEPVLPGTLRRFAGRFAEAGFRHSSFVPVYGLAEATLAATMTEPDATLRFECFERTRLEQRGEAVTATPESEPSGLVELAAVGRPREVGGVRIVDESGQGLPERRVGLIEVGGPSVMSGYFRNREASERALHQGFVRTGDLGFFADGDLFVVGRRKETIIKGGRNLYPYDLEAAAGAVPGVRAGRVVAFGVSNAENGTEDIVLVCETKIKDVAERKALARAVKAAVFMATQARIDVLELVDPGVLTKTSSGKLQRSAVRERYQRGALVPQQPVSWLLRVKAGWARIRHRR